MKCRNASENAITAAMEWVVAESQVVSLNGSASVSELLRHVSVVTNMNLARRENEAAMIGSYLSSSMSTKLVV